MSRSAVVSSMTRAVPDDRAASATRARASVGIDAPVGFWKSGTR